MEDEQIHPLSIGSVVGGHSEANRGWKEPIRELSERVAKARVGVESPLNLNIVFHVPGSVVRSDWSGVRTGSFSKHARLLMVQVALPELAPADALEHLRVVAMQALDQAEEWAERKQLADRLDTRRDALARA